MADPEGPHRGVRARIHNHGDVVVVNNDLLQAAASGRLSPKQARLQLVASQSKAISNAELLVLAEEGKKPLAQQLMDRRSTTRWVARFLHSPTSSDCWPG
jgi:hypothetical protein